MPASNKSLLADSRASAEVLKDSLVDLEANPAFQLVQDRLEDLLLQTQRLLVREEDTQSLRKQQGRAEAFEAAIDMRKALLAEIENTDWERVENDGSKRSSD